MDESAEEQNPNERFLSKKPLPVTYTEKVPIEFFDFIIIDESKSQLTNFLFCKRIVIALFPISNP